MIDESNFQTCEVEKFDGEKTERNSDPDRGIVKSYWLLDSRPSTNSRWREKFDERSEEDFNIDIRTNNKYYITTDFNAKDSNEEETKSEIERLDSTVRNMVQEINSEIEKEKRAKLEKERKEKEAKENRREYFPRVFDELEEKLDG